MSEGLCVFGGVDMRLGPCVRVCEFVLVLVSMPISVLVSADTSVDGGLVCVWCVCVWGGWFG